MKKCLISGMTINLILGHEISIEIPLVRMWHLNDVIITHDSWLHSYLLKFILVAFSIMLL